jgi:hypothetical protein
MQNVRATSRDRAPTRCDVLPEDLQKLDVLHRILRLLNDARQGAKPIAALVEELPVLEARVRRAYLPGADRRAERGEKGEPPATAVVLSMIGNQAFEALLLELLEDLTVLAADTADTARGG